MRTLIIIFSFLFYCNHSFLQDTLYQTNGGDYGYDQTYVLKPNGTFFYSTRCHCTSSTSIGQGTYIKKKRKLICSFSHLKTFNGTSICTRIQKSDSVKILTFSAVDSVEIDLFSFKDTNRRILVFDDSLLRPESEFIIKAYGFEELKINPVLNCQSYQIYMVPKFDTIPQGEVHILNRKGKIYKRTFYQKRKKKRFKRHFNFEIKLQEANLN